MNGIPIVGTPYHVVSYVLIDPPCVTNARMFEWFRISFWLSHFLTITFAGSSNGRLSSSNFQRKLYWGNCWNASTIAICFSRPRSLLLIFVPSEKRTAPSFPALMKLLISWNEFWDQILFDVFFCSCCYFHIWKWFGIDNLQSANWNYIRWQRFDVIHWGMRADEGNLSFPFQFLDIRTISSEHILRNCIQGWKKDVLTIALKEFSNNFFWPENVRQSFENLLVIHRIQIKIEKTFAECHLITKLRC